MLSAGGLAVNIVQGFAHYVHIRASKEYPRYANLYLTIILRGRAGYRM